MRPTLVPFMIGSARREADHLDASSHAMQYKEFLV